MYILYIDESGNPDDPADTYFVLGGVAIFERQIFYLSNKINEIQEVHFPGQPPIEFHATEIRAGKGFWRKVPREKRTRILSDLGGIINLSQPEGVSVFGVAIEKSDKIYGEKAVELATEEICRKFDIFLMRRHHEFKDTQRGLIVFAEGRFQARSRIWVRDFRELGTKWGILRNLADVPYFAATKDNRMLQVADFVSHAVYLLYEKKQPELIKKFLGKFAQKNGVLHGLTHHKKQGICDCPACHSRRNPGDFGPAVG